MLHYIIIVKFDLSNVPKICHFKFIKDSFMSFSNIKSTCYTTKKMFLGIQYSLNLFQTFSSVSIQYEKYCCIHLPNILNIDLT
jgi:hypothetical protein